MRRLTLVLCMMLGAVEASAQMSLAPPASVSASGGQTVHVPLTLANPAGPIDAFGLTLTYPTALLTFESVSTTGTLTDGWFVVTGSENTPGTVTIGGFNPSPAAGSGVLAVAVFQVKASVLGAGPLALSAFLDDLAGASTTGGTFTAVVAAGASGLLGQYYDNINFTGALLTRIDPVVSFDWVNGAPDPSMGIDDYSVRWTGWVQPDFSQTYTFYTQTDDGVRLWVNNQLIVDRWVDQSVTEWSGAIALSAGTLVPVTMEFYERGGQAVARLLWSSASQAKQVIPSDRLLAAPCVAGAGDFDGNGLITDGDAACAFDVFLAGQTLPAGCNYQSHACELIAADVTCDGAVTPGDAQAIARRALAALGPAGCFGQGTPPAAGAPYSLALMQRVVDEGGTPRLEVTLAVENGVDLDAFGARLTFPSAQLAFERIEAGFVTSSWNRLDGASASAGVVVIGGQDPLLTAPSGPGELCRIYFDFLVTPGIVAGLTLTNLTDDFAGASLIGTVTGVGPATRPHRLHQNHPNPFNPSTHLRYDVGGTVPVPVRIAVYDVRGALVRVLVDATIAPGVYLAGWDGRIDGGREAASGVYFVHMTAGIHRESRRMVLLK